MTQKIPRNTLLHERNHKRKAGAHGPAKRPVVPSDETVCICTFTQRLVGDGCHVCNPSYAASMMEEDPEPPKTLTNGLSAHSVYEWYEKKGKLK